MVLTIIMQRMPSETLCLVVFSIVSIANAAIVPPPWANPTSNPCATQPRGWQLLYWPADGKCYKIFQIGAPCPETMELSPSAVGSETTAECRCPPGTAQSPRDALCHPIFTRASCPKGQYFAPVPESLVKPPSKKRWGVCRDPEPCLSSNEVFWPRDGKCYSRHTRGPCPKGELLILDKDGLAACACSRDGELGKFYSPYGGIGCYEHYTKGPCQEPGELFLPGGKCGCHEDMPQFHKPTNMCYQLGGVGPCAPGHQFNVPSDGASKPVHATCSCKPNYVLYEDGICYRLHTQGPCQSGDMLVNSTTCVPVPCKRGRLYFPRERTCYKIGSSGPCPSGQVVLYDYSARPSVDGISYNGVCGCTGALKSAGKCEEAQLAEKCEETPGMVLMNNTCHKLYTQGPCAEGEWLVAQRSGKVGSSADDELFRNRTPMAKARCECRPGYKRTTELESNSIVVPGKCQAPAVGLAKFLNEHVKSVTV
ncbi:multiple epidermal growth factor-like domains protein 10 isoform X1 [Nasonia vitripennis]|uniref:DUF4789 domain-containing protein n=2 Tax=Nasonia vitripennis TaxID=7425 RepID=A0A7M7LVD9_NASVI|nr:multiple epidermal growth factor-like domains protein 10 isoform X1 [Nasonia vitripennis]